MPGVLVMTWRILHGDALEMLRTLPEASAQTCPFAGAATTGLEALRLGRDFVGVELNAEYITMAERRLIGDAPLWNTPAEEALS